MLCDTAGLALRHLQMGFALFFLLCWAITYGPCETDGRVILGPVPRVEAEQAANGEHILHLIEAKNNKP